MTFHFVLLFSVTVFVASIIPGPSMLLALTHGMQYGARKTVASALGNVVVTLIQASISIAGLGTILVASEAVFHLVKWAGAAYLVYIGATLLLSSGALISEDETGQAGERVSSRKMFMQGALVTAGNPKAIVFFTAIFPQFINPEMAYMTQSSVLLGICAVIAFVCFMIYAVSGQKVISVFSKAKVGKYVKKVIGGTFIGAGIGLAASNR
ncbi:LysE family translocator [Pseudodesulfovibrio sp. zrk46]|uniref:LysE family translocator n=1 Tax=Pseudodesulfovibrio sp. zrk46 TaxID=2725288 RepID=UPI00144A271F|nr:LysE family translocator [Pseudodesulfovibrio sp. zrk46]QJB55499.1 LysE family translocator [Pseudodesulfovibrio sp. zrk46]